MIHTHITHINTLSPSIAPPPGRLASSPSGPWRVAWAESPPCGSAARSWPPRIWAFRASAACSCRWLLRSVRPTAPFECSLIQHPLTRARCFACDRQAPTWLFLLFMFVWGAAGPGDSPQFSSLSASYGECECDRSIACLLAGRFV